MRILIVRLSAIGDCLMGTPVAEALRRSFPDAHIGWVVHPLSENVIRGNPFLDQVHVLPRKRFVAHLPRLALELRSQDYDTAIDLQGLFKSALVARLSGAKRRIGPSKGHERVQFLYNELVEMDEKEHVIKRYLDFAAAVGARWDIEPEMHMPFGEAEVQAISAKLSANGLEANDRFIAINPFTSRTVKDWPPERFGVLADHLQRHHKVKPVFTGGPKDREGIDQIIESMETPALNLAGQTNLNELAALLSRSRLFVGGDTGPLHIAQAAGTRVLALFGPTDPRILGPRNAKHKSVTLNLECSPCRHKVCPIGHPCLLNLSTDRVIELAEQMLQESHAPSLHPD